MAVVDRAVAGIMPALPRPLVRRLAEPYIAGPRLEDALACIRRLHESGRAATVDLLGEEVRDRAGVLRLAEGYEAAIEALAREPADTGLSLKPTALGLRLEWRLCLETARRLVAAAAARGLGVTLDMEDSSTTDDTIALYRRLREDGFDDVGLALQAYLRRTPADLRALLPLRPRVRVVKGIWVEPRRLAWSEREAVRDAFAWLVDALLGGGCYVEVASHDEWVQRRSLQLIGDHGTAPDGYEFQMLLGVAGELGDALLADGHRLRVYVPYGEDWLGYSLRRFRENPHLAGTVAGDVAGRARRRLGRRA